MRLNLFFLFFGLCIVSVISAQNNNMQVSVDAQGRKVAVGELSEQYLLSDSTNPWFKNGMNAYTPDNDAVAFLQRENKNFTVVVYGGTWCSDTQDLLPKFYRVVHDADLDSTSIKLYGLDADKLGIDKVKPADNIEFVPTFILMKDGKEIGRIVEAVRNSIEKDMVNILKRAGIDTW